MTPIQNWINKQLRGDIGLAMLILPVCEEISDQELALKVYKTQKQLLRLRGHD